MAGPAIVSTSKPERCALLQKNTPGRVGKACHGHRPPFRDAALLACWRSARPSTRTASCRSRCTGRRPKVRLPGLFATGFHSPRGGTALGEAGAEPQHGVGDSSCPEHWLLSNTWLFCPGPGGSIGRGIICTSIGCRFEPRSGHVPGLWVLSPGAGGAHRSSQRMSLSHIDVSLCVLSLSLFAHSHIIK